MFKNFLVRKLANALSDYLTGINAEGVQAGLNLDTGKLDLQAGLNPDVLRPLGFELLESRIEAHVTVPWRKISSQPTRFHLKQLQLKVAILPPGAAAQSLETRRARKENVVKRLEEAGLAQDEDAGSSQPEGRLARLGTTIVRLVQVQIGNVHAEVDRSREKLVPVHVELDSAQLTSFGADWRSSPDPEDPNMYKLFDLGGLLMHTKDMHLLGPLALELKLAHMPQEQRLRIQAAAGDEPWIAHVDKVAVAGLRQLALSVAAAHTAEEPSQSSWLPSDAGHIYVGLHRRRSELSGSELQQLHEIEDAAPPKWIAAWRVYMTKADDPSLSQKGRPRRRWWWNATEEEQKDRDEALEKLLDEAEEAGLIPEFQAPTMLDVDIRMPNMQAVILGQEHRELNLEMRGARLLASTRARPPSRCETTASLWEFGVQLTLESITARADKDMLVQFIENSDSSSATAVDIDLHAKQRDVHVTGTPPFDFVFGARVEPTHLFLIAVGLRSALLTVMDVFSGLSGESHAAAEGSVVPPLPVIKDSMQRRPSSGPLALPPTSGVAQEGEVKARLQALLADGQSTLQLDACIHAPDITWLSPSKDAELRMRLGSFHLRTCSPSSASVATGEDAGEMILPDTQAVTATEFGLISDLQDTSIALCEISHEHLIFGPGRVALAVWKEPGKCWASKAKSWSVRCLLDPGLVNTLGQLIEAMDFALAPLAWKVEAAARSAPASPRLESPRLSPRSPFGGGASRSQKARTQATFEFDFRGFELGWGHRGEPPTLVARIGGAYTQVDVKEKTLSVTASMQQLAMLANQNTLLLCEKELTLQVESEERLIVLVKCPPMSVHWISSSVRSMFDTCGEVSRQFVDGQAKAKTQLPSSRCNMVKKIIEKSGTKVLEAKQYVSTEIKTLVRGHSQNGFGDADEADVLAGPGAPTSLARVLTVTVECEELETVMHPGPGAPMVQWVRFSIHKVRGDFVCEPTKANANFRIGDLIANMGSRRILMGRRPDDELLSVEASTMLPVRDVPPSISARWAQIAVVLRQRDVDLLLYILRCDVRQVLFPPKADFAVDLQDSSHGQSVQQTVPTAASPDLSSDGQSREAFVDISLSIRAPLIFIPKDTPSNASLLVPVHNLRAVQWEEELNPGIWTNVDSKLNEELNHASDEGLSNVKYIGEKGESYMCDLVARRMNSVTRGKTWRIRAREVDDETSPRGQTNAGEVRGPVYMLTWHDTDGAKFVPALQEGYMVVDLGNLLVKQSAQANLGDVTLEFRGTRLFTVDAGSPEWKDLNIPLEVYAEVVMDTHLLDVRLRTPIPRSSSSPTSNEEAVPKLMVTRAQLTLILDIIWCNFNYTAGEARSNEMSNLLIGSALVPRGSDLPAAKKAASNTVLKMAFEWTGALSLDVAFTGAAPLASLQLVDGLVELETSKQELRTRAECQYVLVEDRRRQALNVDKAFMECRSQGGAPAFKLSSFLPATPAEEAVFSVVAQRAAILVLPQLINDLMTWSLSAYQQSAQVRSSIALAHCAPYPIMQTRMRVSIDIPDVAVRFAGRWDSKFEYFQTVGHVNVSLLMAGSTVTIRHINLTDGKLQRKTSLERVTYTLAQGFAMTAHGKYEGAAAASSGEGRKATLTFEHVEVQPCEIRLDLTDYSVLVSSLMQLTQMDAASAEPKEELNCRDPLARFVQSEVAVAGFVTIGSMVASLTCESHGHKGRPVLRGEFACPVVKFDLRRSKGYPLSGLVDVLKLQVSVSAFNDRAGAWEPLLAPCAVSMHGTCGDHRDKPGEALARLKVEVIDVVHVVFSPRLIRTFIELAPSLLGNHVQAKADHTQDRVWGLNISGVDCRIAALDENLQLAGEMELESSDEPTLLDELFKSMRKEEDTTALVTLPPVTIRADGVAAEPLLITAPIQESYVWKTEAGPLLVRVLMPRPPQRVFVITSIAALVNTSSVDLEVAFLSKEGMKVASSPMLPVCSAPLLEMEAELQRPHLQPVVAKSALKNYDIRVEVLSLSGLVAPQDLSAPDNQQEICLTPYVAVSSMDVSKHTRPVRAERGDAVFDERVNLVIQDVGLIGDLEKQEVCFTVRSLEVASGIAESGDDDPVIGSAKAILGAEELKGVPLQKMLDLSAEGYDGSVGLLKIMLHVTESDPTRTSKAIRHMKTAGCILPIGHVMSVPLEALRAHAAESDADEPDFSFKVRPLGDSGSHFSWGSPFTSGGLDAAGAVSRSPVRTSEGKEEESVVQGSLLLRKRVTNRLTEILIEAPFYVANACPCQVHFSFGECQPKPLGDIEVECSAQDLLSVLDGNGGRWDIPPDGQMYICPMRLDADSQFHWYAPYSKTADSQQRTFCYLPNAREVNAMGVVREGSKTTWRMFSTKAAMDFRAFQPKAPQLTLQLEPHKEYACLSSGHDGLMFSIAMREQTSKNLSKWSDPIPLIVPPGAPMQCIVRLKYKWSDIFLEVARQPGQRRLVVFASHWFTDSTGLDVGVTLSSKADRHPQFGNNINLLGEVQRLHLSLPELQTVEAEIPVRGSGNRVALSETHDCVLMVDAIARRTTFDVPCRLLTLAPRLMVFSQVEGYEVGFCQAGSGGMYSASGAAPGARPVWLNKGESWPLFWSGGGGAKAVVIALRLKQQVTATGVRQGSKAQPQYEGLVWHGPFTAEEDGIGAYPLATRLSAQAPPNNEKPSSDPKLVSVQVNQAGQLFTMTVAGDAHCHQLVNKHPCLKVRARFVDEAKRSGATGVLLEYGSRCALGRSNVPQGGTHGDVELELHEESHPWRKSGVRKVTVSLDRTEVRKEAGVPAVVVKVELRARVALITVEPMVRAEALETQKWNIKVDSYVPFICCSLVGENPHEEVYSATLEDLSVKVSQNSIGQRGSETELQKFQLDLYRPSPFVVASSSTSPALKFKVWRDDVKSRDIFINYIRMVCGTFEVTAFDNLVEETNRIAGELMTEHTGLEPEAVLKRAWNRFDLAVGPPVPSAKYVVREMSLQKLSLTAFCCLSPQVLPRWLAKVIQLTSGFAQTIEIEGAKVNLDEVLLTSFKGSLDALLLRIRKQYSDQWIKNLPQLLGSSNVFFRGVFSRKFWLPKAREVLTVRRPALKVKAGVIVQEPLVYSIAAFGAGETSRGSQLLCSEGDSGELQCYNPGRDAVKKWAIVADDRESQRRYVLRLLRGTKNCLSVDIGQGPPRVCLAKLGAEGHLQKWQIQAADYAADWYMLSVEDPTKGRPMLLSGSHQEGSSDSVVLKLTSSGDGPGNHLLWNIPGLSLLLQIADKDGFLDLQSQPDMFEQFGREIGGYAAGAMSQGSSLLSTMTWGASDYGFQAVGQVSNFALDTGMSTVTGVFRIGGNIASGVSGIQESGAAGVVAGAGEGARRAAEEARRQVDGTLGGLGRAFGFGGW